MNDIPVADDQSFSTSEDIAYNGTLTGDDGDPMDNAADNQTLTYQIDTDALHGDITLTVSTGSFTYTPDPEFNGTDLFSFTITDNGSDGSTAHPLTSVAAQVSIDVNAVNDKPVIVDISNSTVSEEGDFNLALSASDVDILTNNQTLSYSASSDNLSLVAVSISDDDGNGSGQLNFDLQDDQHGSSEITVIVSDSEVPSLSDTTVFTLTVDPVNDIPVADDQLFSTSEDTDSLWVLSADDGDPMDNATDNQILIYEIITSTLFGSLTLQDDTLGTILYSPMPDFSGYDIFTYAVHDSGLGVIDDVLYSDTVQVDITINPVNDPPIIEFISPSGDSLVYTNIEGYGEFQIFARIYDHDSDSLSILWIDSLNGSRDTLSSDDYTFVDSIARIRLDTTLYAGRHNIILFAEDNGEQNPNYIELNDQQFHSADTSTQIKIGYPKLAHEDNQAFLKSAGSNPIRTLLPLTLINGEIENTINAQNGLALMLPSSQNVLKWASATEFEVSQDGKLTNPRLSADSSKFIFDVVGSWASDDTITIENLQLKGFSDVLIPSWIRLSADASDNYDIANAQSMHHLRVGDTQLNVSRHHAYTIGDDSNRILDSIKIWENTVPVISKNVGIHLKIPEALHMKWNSDAEFVWIDSMGVQRLDMFGRDTILQDGAVLSVEILTDLTKADTLYLKGPLFEDFAAISDSSILDLSVVYPHPDSSYSWQRSTANTIRIGDPRIFSVEPHVFIRDLDTMYSDTLAPIIIKENEEVAAIQATEDIIIALPDTSQLVWDLTQLSSIIFNDNLIAGISLDDPHHMRIDISSDLEPGDSLLFRQLRVSNIISRQKPDTLLMSLNQGLSYNRVDTTFVGVGAPSITSIDTQKFLIQDISQFLTPIQIIEDQALRTIGSKYGIVLQLEELFPVHFDSTISMCSIMLNGISSEATVSAVGNPGQKKIQISSQRLNDMTRGDTLLIEGLKVSGFSSSFGFASGLTLLSVKGDSRFTARDVSVKAIGRPDFNFEETIRALYGGLNSIELPLLSFSDDPEVNIVQGNHRINLNIPESVPLRWQEVPFLQIEGDYQDVSPVPQYLSEKKLVMEINADFNGDIVGIKGLRVFVDGYVNGGEISGGLNDTTFFDTLRGFLSVGDISFASSDSIDQRFFKTNTDSESRTLKPIAIGQGDVSIIDSSLGIILRIPQSLDAYWDPMGIPSIEFSALSLGDSVWYSDNYKDMGLHLGNLPLNETINISGLRFTPFDSSSQGNLQLVLDGGANSMIVSDPFSKIVADPQVYFSESRTYVYGDRAEFARLPDIIIQEDPYVSVLDSAHIQVELPEEIDWWGTTHNVRLVNQFGSSTDIQLTSIGKTLMIAMELLSPEFKLSAGQWLKISQLPLAPIDQTMNRKKAGIKIEIGSQSVPLNVNAELSVGFPSIEIAPSSLALSAEYDFPLEPIKIIESAIPIYDNNRDALFIIPPILQPILNWTISAAEMPPKVRGIELIGDTIRIGFNQSLTPEDTVIIAGLKYSSQQYFESNAHMIDITNSIAQAPLELSYRLNEMTQFKPVAQSVDSISVFPKLFFQDAQVVMNSDTAVIHIPLFPGLLEHSSTLQEGIQIRLEDLSGENHYVVLNSNIDYPQDTTRGHSNNDPFTLEDLSFNLNPQDVSLINIYYDHANRIDSELLIPYVVSNPEALIFVPEISELYQKVASIQKVNLDFGYDLNSWVLSPDSAAVGVRTLSQLSLSIADTTFPNNLQLRVWGAENVVTDTNLILNTPQLELDEFLPDLSDGIYNLEVIGSNQSNNFSLFPVQRQFQFDSSTPIFNLDENSPIFKHSAAVGRNGLGHQIVGQQRFQMSITDYSGVDGELNRVAPIFNTSVNQFDISDVIGIKYEVMWGANGNQIFEDTLSTSIDPSFPGIDGWTINSRLDSLLFSIIDSSRTDKLEALEEEELAVNLLVKISDQAGNTDSILAKFIIVLNSDEALSDEVFNYPNPFNPSLNITTNIRYVLTQNASEGIIVIMDSGGEVVFHRTLESDDLNIGVHEIAWDGTNLYNYQLASGVYFAYVKIADSFKRIKILLLN